MIKLIYITGYGRSGSTLLDMLLGEHPDMFAMGELSTMCRHVWPRNEYCACGARIQNCAVWAPIMARWQGGRQAQYLQLQKRIEPLISPARHRAGTVQALYLDQTEALLAGVSRESGVATLVDSSKLPGRGLALAQSGALDLRVIHLVRDGRAVAHSMSRSMGIDLAQGRQKKLKSRPAYRTALRWRMYNSVAETLMRQVGPGRSVRVRYEDLVTDPVAELKRIGAGIGVDLTDLATRIGAGGAITPQHQMAGSRIRMKPSLVLTSDESWKDEISASSAKWVQRVAGDQLRRYGYL